MGDFRNIAQDWQSWGNSNIAVYTEPSSERVVRTNYADFDESVVAPGQSRATDYSVNSEESGYSSLKDKKLGSDWGDEEKEEEGEENHKMKEEEVMLKELVRIAKEEEKAMEKLKKAAEEQQQRVEEAQRAHKSILAIEEACKRQQLDSEEKERTQSSGSKEKKLEDQSLRKRIEDKRRASKRQEEKMLKLKEADEKKKLQTRKEKLEKVERKKRALERSQRREKRDDVGETVGRKEDSKIELKVEMNRKYPPLSETCSEGQSESAHQPNAHVENDDPKKSNEEGNRGKANTSELIKNAITTYNGGFSEKEGVQMETNQAPNQKENVGGEIFTRHSHSKSEVQDVVTGSSARRRNNIVKRLVLEEEEACGKGAAVEVNHTNVVEEARQLEDDDANVKKHGSTVSKVEVGRLMEKVMIKPSIGAERLEKHMVNRLEDGSKTDSPRDKNSAAGKVRLVVQVVTCKQCHWATKSREELEKHTAKYHTAERRWW